MSKKIDYLFEDPVINNQKYGLISIVGPNMPQKNDIWAFKIRGVADTTDQAGKMAKKLRQVDDSCDIYIVEIGKFSPLQVNPSEIQNQEYGDDQLNCLLKSYLENKEKANDHFQVRKQQMIKDAIREGKDQEKKNEHPIAVLQRIRDYEEKEKKIKESLEDVISDLKLSKDKFDNYTDEEKCIANEELSKAIEQRLQESETKSEITPSVENSIESIRDEIMNDINGSKTESDKNPIDVIMNQIDTIDIELKESNDTLELLDKENSPNIYKRIEKQISELLVKKANLKTQLENKNAVNDYINNRYQNSAYEGAF